MKKIIEKISGPIPDEMRVFLKKSSLERIRLISIAILLIALTNDKECMAQIGMQFLPFGILIVIFALIFLAVSTRLLKNNDVPQHTVDIVDLIFWCVLCIGIIPVIILDSFIRTFPINMTILLLSFLMLPITERRAARIIFGAFTVVNLLLAAIGNPGISYMFAIVIMNIMGYMFSRHIHGDYISLINKMAEETRTDFLTLVANRKGGFERSRSALAL